jgi:GxxExxY protein
MEPHHEGHEATQRPTKANFKDRTAAIIGCALRVHSHLGAGLLESVYEACLCSEMGREGLAFERQVAVPIRYRGELLGPALRIDLIVEEVIVEVKAVERLLPVHDAQLITYLKLSGKPLGLLLNFNVPHLRHGIRRKIMWVPPHSPT